MFASFRRGRTYVALGKEPLILGILKLLIAIVFLVFVPVYATIKEKEYRRGVESAQEIASNVTLFSENSQAGDLVHVKGANYTSTVEDLDFNV